MRQITKVAIGEEELVSRDKVSLSGHEFLFKSYYKPLMVFAIKYLKAPEEAEDVVQEVFLQLWRKQVQLPPQEIKSYLFTAVKNGCLKVIRHKKVVQKHESFLQAEDTIEVYDPHHYLLLSEIEKCVEETLGSVSERTQRIFNMSRVEKKKYDEIADQLNISVKTVEAHMSKMLHLLRIRLKPYLSFVFLLLERL